MARALIIYNCEECGKENTQEKWEYNRNKHHFCSAKCSLKRYQRQQTEEGWAEEPCKECGKIMRWPKSRMRTFCSRECASIYRFKNYKPLDKNIDFICDCCGKVSSMERGEYSRRIKNNKKLYCSIRCGKIERLPYVIDESEINNYKDLKGTDFIVFKCKECEEEHKQKYHKFINSINHFCSSRCATRYNGKLIYCFNKGIHLEEYSKPIKVYYRNTPENKAKENTWRKQVFIRDNYTCQHCSDKSGNGHKVILNAHHIKFFKHFPELRYDADNGITLCKKCHKKEHKRLRKEALKCSEAM